MNVVAEMLIKPLAPFKIFLQTQIKPLYTHSMCMYDSPLIYLLTLA